MTIGALAAGSSAHKRYGIINLYAGKTNNKPGYYQYCQALLWHYRAGAPDGGRGAPY